MHDLKTWLRIKWSQLGRWIASPIDETGIAILGVVITAAGALLSTAKSGSDSVPKELGYILIPVGLFLLVAKAKTNYRKLKYSTEIAWRVLDDWEKLEKERHVAAEACNWYVTAHESDRDWRTRKRTHPKVKYLEYVLDSFDDLAFFLEGNQISDDVAHHYFGHYILLYWLSGAREYALDRQKDEPYTWRRVQDLFDRILVVECERTKKRQSDVLSHLNSKRAEYLEEEMESEAESEAEPEVEPES